VLLRLMQAGRGYLKDGDRSLEPRELLRLAVLGGKVQAPACVTQCAAALGANMSVEDAVEVLSSMPGEMDGLEEIRALRHKALDMLVAATYGDDNPQLKAKVCACLAGVIGGQEEGEVDARVWRAVGNLLERGGLGDGVMRRLAEAMAEYLWPIHELWEPGRGDGKCWSEGLSAKFTVGARRMSRAWLAAKIVGGDIHLMSAVYSSSPPPRGAEAGAAERGIGPPVRERRLRAGQWVGRLPAGGAAEGRFPTARPLPPLSPHVANLPHARGAAKL
jgi:hypothetical protein